MYVQSCKNEKYIQSKMKIVFTCINDSNFYIDKTWLKTFSLKALELETIILTCKLQNTELFTLKLPTFGQTTKFVMPIEFDNVCVNG